MTVIFYGGVREYTSGLKSVEIDEAKNIRELIVKLIERFGKRFEEKLFSKESCFFLVNGKGIMTTGGLETPLSGNDRVELLQHVDGG